jgi:DNA-binding CsgD family transcriptional regulator
MIVRQLPEPIALDAAPETLHAPRRLDFVETLASADHPDRKLSVFLLDLYAAAVREEVGGFERHFFSLLGELVELDAGWTGVATAEDNRPINHSSFVYRLPDTFFRQWINVVEHDPLADLTNLLFGKAMVIRIGQDQVAPEFDRWARSFGLMHLMRTCARDNRFGLIGFLSIYRRDASRPFSALDVEIIETLIPHLAAAMRINRTMQLFMLGRESGHSVRRAICDAYGVIHRADAGFGQDMALEWPQWQGDTLPDAIRLHLQAGTGQPFLSSLHRFEFNPIAGLFIVEMRHRSPADLLAERELETITHFANGASYKEVARRMNISPATVRHHLRSAYKKLNVHDKAQMSRLLTEIANPG